MFREVSSALGDELTAEARVRIETSRRRLAEGRFQVVCCGEFRRGKSSLLNALIGRQHLFPVDVDITTAVVTTLEWAEGEYAIVYEGDPAKPEEHHRQRRISLAEVHEYASEQANPRNRKQVSRVAMFAPISQLESGLVLVDTPGIGSVNSEHGVVTYGFIPQADAILYVCSVTEPLSQHEADFLAYALEECPIVVTAVTKADLVVDPSPVVDAARERIYAVLVSHASDPRTSAEELVIIPVSAFRKWRAEQIDEELLAESGFRELEAELWAGLAVTCGAVQIITAMTQIEEAIHVARAPIDNELAALEDNERFEQIERELKDALKQSEELLRNSSRWRRELETKLDDAAEPIKQQLEKDLHAARTELDDELSAPAGLENLAGLISTAARKMVTAAITAGSALEEEAGQIARELEQMTALPVSVGPAPSAGFEPIISVPKLQARERPGMLRRARESWMGGLAGGGFGATAGALIGTFLLPGVGTAVGAGLGGMVGQVGGWLAGDREAVARADRDGRRQGLQEARSRVSGQLATNEHRALRSYDKVVVNLKRAIISDLESKIQARHESLQASVRALSADRDVEAAKRAERLAWLTGRRDIHEALRTRLAELSRAVEALLSAVDGGT
jgi:GTPase SAR1 family protein